jgi:hypothetical protein
MPPQGGPLPGQGEAGPGGPGLPPLVFPATVSFRRPEDLLVCTLRFVGFAFLTDPPRLDRAAPDAYVVVEFPPQSFSEEAFLLTSGQKADSPAGTPQDPNQEVALPPYPLQNVPASADDSVPTTLPAARIRMAGPSRVVVAMPTGQESVAFDLPSILAATRDWPMRLAAGAVPDSSPAPVPPGPQEPASDVTALELPYRLLLSPLDPATWRLSITPVTQSGRSELWHARLADPDDATGAEPSSRIRAIWSPDYRPPPQLPELFKWIPPGPPGPPNPALIRMSLDPVDRAMLVTLMSGFDATQSGSTYVPLSSEAKRLHLTALGGLLDAEGSWTALPDLIDLEQWRHQATLGRDHYVRVVYKGWLCPFGHAASLIKVTERRFQPLGSDATERIAVLRQRFFVVVRQPVRPYSGENHVHEGRDFPFTQVELLTRVTPDLVDPNNPVCSLATPPSGDDPYGPYPDSTPPGATIVSRMLFWPTLSDNSGGTTDFLFQIAATDISGNRVTFAMPLLFVGKSANDLALTDLKGMLKEAYNALPATPKRQASFGGASVTFARVNPGDRGDPTLPTADATFRAGDLKLASPTEANFYPEIYLANVGIKPVQKLLAQPGFTAEVTYPDFYAQHGFDPTQNAGRVFLQLTSALPLQFGGNQNQPKSDALGALATPRMNLLGLSTIMGPVAGQNARNVNDVKSALANVGGGKFDPSDFFPDATLLGGIKLGDILQVSMSLAGAEVPKLLTRDFPDHIEASFDLSTPVIDQGKQNLLIPNADQTSGSQLVMSGLVRTPLDSTQSSFSATAELNNFKVNLFGFIILWFDDLRFDAKSGQKPDVTVQMHPGEEAVMFGGPLEFVNSLRNDIPSNGFSDPPGIVVTPSGISASYSLNLPALEVGVFALSNVALGAGFSLPFDGTPVMVTFAFSTREHPFSLAVSLLGGGGFLRIGVTSDGVREIEAALEFGAVVAIDLGVASGSVEVKAGIYFHWLEPTPGNGSVELAGYVRIHGELCVLALISVALTFNLQLGYEKESGSSVVYGEADLTVEIDILMFSTSVSVRCRREFSGGVADPKFIDQIPTQAIWSQYCDAFATEAA